jgi:hypothetical protein
MIKSIIVMDGVGNFKEIIKDYDFFCALHFDQHLSISERLKRRKNEGFATNLFGTNTGVVGRWKGGSGKVESGKVGRWESGKVKSGKLGSGKGYFYSESNYDNAIAVFFVKG